MNTTPTRRKRENAVAMAEQITKLVAVIQRQFTLRTTHSPTTDNAAARALGYQLGAALVTFLTVCLDESVLQSVRDDQVLAGLWCGGHQLHPSIAAAFFRQVQKAYQQDKEDLLDVHWLANWILRLEEAEMNNKAGQSSFSPVYHALHTYAATLLQHQEVSAVQFLQLYQRLRQENTRLQLVALATGTLQRDVWSPLLASAACGAPEAWAILQQSSRSLRCSRNLSIEQVLQVLDGMTQALQWSLLVSHVSMTWWYAWWYELIQLGQATWLDKVAGNPLAIPIFMDWWQGLWTETLPCLLEATDTVQPNSFDLYPNDEIDSTNPSEWSLVQQPLPWTPTAALAWASWLLSSTANKQAAYQFWHQGTKASHSPTVQHLRLIVTLCLASDEHWDIAAPQEGWTVTSAQDNFELVIPLLPMSTDHSEKLWKHLVEYHDFSHSKYSPLQQCAALLCGMLLLQSNLQNGFKFMEKLLQTYPHLSITLMPIVIFLLNNAAKRVDGKEVLEVLDFACRALVLDSHCATEFWNVLLHLLQPEQSAASLRGTILRYFPKLCQGNRRLYRRIIETLGGAVGEANLEIRLAVAATVAELAQHDLVRDVADVIGWIQGWLSIVEPQKPIERIIVYYALESLHYLVVAEELDFDVVVKVLNKRLCPITDMERIRGLHAVIQEALMRLLGDGECGSDDTDGEEDGPQVPTVSPQVQRAVQTLLELGVALLDAQGSIENETLSADLLPQYRIIHSIIEALNKYSNLALGLDEQDFRDTLLDESSSAPSGVLVNYRRLKRIVVDCVENLPDVAQLDGPSDSLVKLSQRLLKFEEDSLGTSLWLKKGKPSTSQTQVSKKSIQSILPDPGTVKGLVGQRLSTASAISCLFCSDGSSLDDLRDHADASIASENPLLLVLALQGFLSIASRVVSAQSQHLDKLLNEVESWDEDSASVDAMYLSSACILLYLPPKLKDDASGKSLADDSIDAIVDAFRSFRFENMEIAKICLGLVGVSSLRNGSLTLTTDMAEMLIDTVQGYGGEPSFGAFYGMCLIAQMLPVFQHGTSSDSDSATRMYYRIISLVVEELLQCYESPDATTTITSLIACLKSGTIQSDILNGLRLIPPQSLAVEPGKIEEAKYLSLCCAVALPSLSRLNDQMFLAVFQLFELLDWGGGKGYVIPQLLNSSNISGILKLEDRKAKYQKYSELIEQRINSENPADLDDLLLAVSGASSESISHVMRRMVVGNTDFLDDEERATTLLAALMKSVGIPCLGAAPFPEAPFIVPEVSKLDIRDVLETLEAVDNEDVEDTDTKYADMGIIALSIMASLSRDSPSAVSNALPASVATKAVKASAETIVSSADFSKLPSPLPDTALAGVMIALENALVRPSADTATLARLMGSLELVALPKQFSKNLLNSLLGTLEDDITKEAWVSLLVSQCHGRRPATMDGSDFVQLYHQIAAADENEVLRCLGRGSPVNAFVKGLEHFIPKCSQRHVNHVLTNVWRICWRLGQSLQHCFLGMCRNILNNGQLPRKVIEMVAETLINQVLIDLQSVPLEQTFRRSGATHSTFREYIACVQHVPMDLLDKYDFFRYGKSPGVLDGDVLRVLCAAEFSSVDSFGSQRRKQERSKIVSFLARGLKVLDDLSRDDLRYIYCSLVETVDSTRGTAEQLAEVFEVLLQLPPQSSAYGLEWLALFVRKTVVTSHSSPVSLSLSYLWCNDWRASESLPVLAPVVVKDLPIYLGHLVREKQMASIVFNLLHRLLSHWTPPAASPATIHVLRRALATCRPAKEDILVSMITDSMLADISNEAESTTAA